MRQFLADAGKQFGNADLLYLPLTGVLVFYTVPVVVAANNVSDFGHLDPAASLSILGAVALLAAALGLLAAWLLRAFGARPLLVVARFAFFFCLSAGLAFPLAKSSGMADISQLPVDRTNFLIALVLAAGFTLATFTRWQGLLLAVVLTVVAGNAVSNSLTVFSSIAAKVHRDGLTRVSADRNLFVVGFDGMPRNQTIEVLQENPEIAAALRDFVAYSAVSGSAPATEASLLTELSGVNNFKANGEGYAGLTASGMLTNVLRKNGIDVYAYGGYAAMFGESEHAYGQGSLSHEGTFATRLSQTAEVLDYALVRTLSHRAAVARQAALEFVRRFPVGDQLMSASQDLDEKLAQRSDWGAFSVSNVFDFERYVERLAVSTEAPVAHFLHFVHTHFPVDFDADCTYRGDDSAWYAANQNREGLKQQVTCALSQFARFVAQLKSIGAYDNSTIVIKGDHGEPVEYNDPRTYEGFTVRGHRLWGFGRYAPFLAIKQRGVSRQEVGFDDRHVSTADLARTLCLEQIGDRFDCSVYPGVDLLGAEPVPADARLFVYIVENADSSFPIGSLEAIEVPRGPEFFSALNDYLTDELVPERAACTPQATTGGTPYNTGLTDGKSWVTWWNGDTAYLKVAGPACLSRVLVLTFAPQSPAAPPASV